MINLFEYKNKATFPEEHFDDLEMFLDDIWNKREKSAYYNEEENREEVQRFLQFFHKILTNFLLMFCKSKIYKINFFLLFPFIFPLSYR